MIFQIHHHFKDIAVYPETKAHVETYSWTLDQKNGDPLVRSKGEFVSEEATRSDIAQVRRSLRGAAFAKVKSPNGCTTSV